MDLIIFLGGLSILFLMYFLFDVNYFIRTIFTIVCAMFRRKIDFLGKSEIYGMVLSSDAGLSFSHMNNARVIREFDFARIDHAWRSGLVTTSISEFVRSVVAAQTCRYRKPLEMFMMYKIQTQPIHYEDKSIVYEHKLISLGDGIVRCIAHIKFTLPTEIEKTVAKHFPDTIKPLLPKNLELWLDYNRANSERLKNVEIR